MHGAISSSPLLRLLVVAVPGLLLAVFFGIQLGEGKSLVGVLIMVAAVGFLLVMSLGRRGILEAAIVGFLIIGYFVGNRGFAQLAIVRPVFIGELGMALVVMLLGIQALLTRDFPKLKIPLVGLVLFYLVYAVIRFSFDVRQYRFDAIRDLAVVYYAAFFFVAYQLGSRPTPRAFLERCMSVAVAAHTLIALVFTFAPHLLQYSPVVSGAPLLFQKGDLTITFSAVCIFFLANRDRIFGLKWLRMVLLFALVACAALSIVRAALLALICVSALLWLAGHRRVFAYLFGGVVAAAIGVMFLTAFGGSVSDSRQVALFTEKFASIFDVSGSYRYETELGAAKSDNNEFRKTFWRVMVEETTSSNPVFGKGFGYNFTPGFERIYARGGWEGLRSPHNYFVTVYGRMGIVGFLIFATIAFLVLRHSVEAALRVRRNQLRGADFSYWCGAVVLLISGTFGVVLEGPMGAIPFWTFLGLALSSPLLPPREATPPMERRKSQKRQFPARRPELIGV